MKSLSFSCLIALLFLTSCTSGEWVGESMYRPKKERFKYKGELAETNKALNTKYLYRRSRSFSRDGVKMVNYAFYGFYPDGRLIIFDLDEKEATPNSILNKAHWQRAGVIGYYKVSGDNISIEYFLPDDGGIYEKRQGQITDGSVIFTMGFDSFIFGKSTQQEKLELTEYPLSN
jgi:hypothetical protein